MNKLDSLKKENLSLRKETELYKGKYKQSVEAYDRLLHAFKQSQRREFGSSSERCFDNDPSQSDMLSNVEARPLVEDDDEEGEDTNPRKRKSKRKDFAKNLPRREVIIPAEDKGPNDRVIRYEKTELLNYVPAVYEIIVQKREVVVSQVKGSDLSTIKIAPNPLRLLPKAGVTESFLANAIVSKFYDRQPLYHLEKKFDERFDFICPRQKLARWVIASANYLQPLVNLIKDTILDYDVTACDPTHIQVLNEPGRAPTDKSYMFTIRGGPPDKKVVCYEYNATQHKQFTQRWFGGYKGYLLVDGQNIFDALAQNQDITLQLCNSHARRKFEPISKAAQKAGLAGQAMSFYKALYTIERRAKDEGMTPEERYAWRLERSKPLMDRFDAWVEEKRPLTLPKSPLGKAFYYVSVRNTGLRRFLEDGRVEIDTNLLEQKNKYLALARNNFLFSYSVNGAKALGVHMSLIFTALEHQMDPYHYYVNMMQRIPHCQTVEDYEALLPWNIELPQPVEQQKEAQI